MWKPDSESPACSAGCGDRETLSAVIERVRQMEALFDGLSDALRNTPARIASDEALREAAGTLSEYLSGGGWLRDYSLDELGLLPADLKRGVLSQDGLYDLLCTPEIKDALLPVQDAVIHGRQPVPTAEAFSPTP